MINNFGLKKATTYAFRQSIKKCLKHLPAQLHFILLDGPPLKYLQGGLSRQLAITKGDQIVYSIAAASIIAKVERDAYMEKISPDFKPYNWKSNKGYGTPSHRQALKDFGPTIHHRKNYIKIIFPKLDNNP